MRCGPFPVTRTPTRWPRAVARAAWPWLLAAGFARAAEPDTAADRAPWPPREITTEVVEIGGRALVGVVAYTEEQEGFPRTEGRVVAGAAATLRAEGGVVVASDPAYRPVTLVPGSFQGVPAVLVGLAWDVEGATTGTWALLVLDDGGVRRVADGSVDGCPSLKGLEVARGRVLARCGTTYDGTMPRRATVPLTPRGFHPRGDVAPSTAP
jgi:hypothetical protein